MTLFPETAPAKKPSKRRENDRYLTPPLATQALLEHFQEVRGDLLIDPCCGDGRMAEAIGDRFESQLLNDIDHKSIAAWNHLDATRIETWQFWSNRPRTKAWVVTNPPFGRAGDIAHLALEQGFSVALLLRLTFLEPTGGRQWLTRMPPTAILVLPRIDFIGAGSTDSSTYAWMIWAEGIIKPGIKVVRAEDIGQQGLPL